jgi:SynChlorMet cassette radical SAM/SPASM protein ScmF
MEKESQDIRYPLRQIYFYLTEGCNLRCRHCWISPKFQDENHVYPSLDVSLFQSIIGQAKKMGLSGVKLTGGEPFLHPRIPDLLEFVKEEQLGLNIESNGILITPELSELITACENPFVAVSLDGTNEDTHDRIRGVKGAFKGALKGIVNLVNVGIKPQIIMTIMAENRHQVEEMLSIAESIGAGSVKFNIVQPSARGKIMHEKGEALSIKDLVKLGQWIESEIVPKSTLPVYHSHPQAFRPLGRLFGEKGDGCVSCGIMRILGVLADGSYALCGIGQTVPDLVLGHAAKDRLGDVWRDSKILNIIREGLPDRFKGICGKCLMLGSCLGSCLAQNYSFSRDFWAPYWYCDMAYREGLFPETRIRPDTSLPSN